MRFAPLVPKPKPTDSGKRKSQAQPFRIMAKLEVGGVHDPLEREADAIADRVMGMPAPSHAVSVGLAPAPEPDAEPDAEVEGEEDALSEAPPVSAFAGAAALPGGSGFVVQRRCASCEAEDEDEIRRSVAAELLMRKCDTCEDEEEIRRACASCDIGDTDDSVLRRTSSFAVRLNIPSSRRHMLRRREAAAGARGGQASQDFTTRVHHLQHGGGGPLSASVRAFLEPRMGVELSGVRVHADPEAGRLARQINARAFTLAQHVFFAPGELRPHSSAGMRLLAHEVAHTLQSSGRVDALRRAPTKEQAALDAAIKNTDHGANLLEQDPKLVAQVDKLRSQLMQLVDDLVVPNQAEGIPSALEDFGVPASLRKKTDASAQRFYKITRHLESRETVESLLMSQWLDAAIELIDLLSECLRHVVTHDAAVGKVFQAQYGKTLKSLKSQAKTLREHKFFEEGKQIEAKLRPLEEAKAKADRAAEIQRQLDLVRQEMSAYWNWQPLKAIQAEHARLSAKLFAMGGKSATGVLEVQIEVLAGLLGLRDEDKSKLDFSDKDVAKEHYAYIADAEGEHLSQLGVHDLESLGMAALDGLSAIAESTKRIDAAVTGIREAIQAGRPYDLTTLKLRELLVVERELWRQVEASPPGDPLAEQLRALLTGEIQNYRQHRAARVAEGQRRQSMSDEELGRMKAMSGVLAQLSAGWELGVRVPVDLQSLTHWELAELRVQIEARLRDPHDTRHRAELRALRDELETNFVEKRQGYIANRRHEIIPDNDAALQSALKTFSAANSKAALGLDPRQRFPLDLDQLELALEFGRLSTDELDLVAQRVTDELSQLGSGIASGVTDDDYHRDRYERLLELADDLGHRIDIQLIIGDPDSDSSMPDKLFGAASRFAFGKDLYQLKRDAYSQAFRTTSLDELAVDHPELVEMIHECAALTDDLFATVLDGTALTGVPRDDGRLFLLNEYMLDLAAINRDMDVEAVAPDTIRAWMKAANMLAREFDELTGWLKYPSDNPWRVLGRQTVAKTQAILNHEFMRMLQVVADDLSAREARAQNIEKAANWLIIRVDLQHDEFKKVIRNPILGPNKGAEMAHAIMARLKSYKLTTSDLPTIFNLAKQKDTSYFVLAMARGHTVRVLQEQYGVQHLLAFVDEADFATMLTISENEGLMASGTEEMDYSMTDALECAAGFMAAIVPGLWHAVKSIPAAVAMLLDAETWAKVNNFLEEKLPQFYADEDFRMKAGKAFGAASAQIIAQLREMSPYDFGEKLAYFVAPLLLDLILSALTAGAAQGLKIRYVTNFGKLQSKVDSIVDELLGAFSWKMVELGIKARGAQKYLDTMETLAAVRKRIANTLERIRDGRDSLRFGTQTARFMRENAAQRQLERVDLELAELAGRWASNQIDKAEFAKQLEKLERRAEIAERRLYPERAPDGDASLDTGSAGDAALRGTGATNGVDNVANARPDGRPAKGPIADTPSAREASIKQSGRIESQDLTSQQIDAELRHIIDHPELIEGTYPHRRFKVGDHTWIESPGGRWCRHSDNEICIIRVPALLLIPNFGRGVTSVDAKKLLTLLEHGEITEAQLLELLGVPRGMAMAHGDLVGHLIRQELYPKGGKKYEIPRPPEADPAKWDKMSPKDKLIYLSDDAYVQLQKMHNPMDQTWALDRQSMNPNHQINKAKAAEIWAKGQVINPISGRPIVLPNRPGVDSDIAPPGWLPPIAMEPPSSVVADIAAGSRNDVLMALRGLQQERANIESTLDARMRDLAREMEAALAAVDSAAPGAQARLDNAFAQFGQLIDDLTHTHHIGTNRLLLDAWNRATDDVLATTGDKLGVAVRQLQELQEAASDAAKARRFLDDLPEGDARRATAENALDVALLKHKAVLDQVHGIDKAPRKVYDAVRKKFRDNLSKSVQFLRTRHPDLFGPKDLDFLWRPLPSTTEVHHMLYVDHLPEFAVDPWNLLIAGRIRNTGGADQLHDLFHLVSSGNHPLKFEKLPSEIRERLVRFLELLKT